MIVFSSHKLLHVSSRSNQIFNKIIQYVQNLNSRQHTKPKHHVVYFIIYLIILNFKGSKKLIIYLSPVIQVVGERKNGEERPLSTIHFVLCTLYIKFSSLCNVPFNL